MDFESALSEQDVAEFVLGASPGTVRALGGIDSHTLRMQIDEVEPKPRNPRVLLVPIRPHGTTEEIVDQIVDLLAESASRLWPVWYTDISFAECQNDKLGRSAAGAIARRAAQQIAGLSASWAEAAVRRMLDQRVPRVDGTLAATELAQLALTISRSGLVIVADMEQALPMAPNGEAVVRALEWVAQHSQAAVVALFPRQLPMNEPVFERILYDARMVCSKTQHPTEVVGRGLMEADEPWLAPWRGQPHPMSDIEQRLHAALTGDRELAPLFYFNLPVVTVRGSRPRADLVWPDGRLVVELDGYGSHGNRRAFIDDRHRDYELTLSGYTVLRLANDEIAQDLGKALEKIRDLVRWRRARTNLEG